MAKIDGRGHTHIVGVLFERQSEHADFFVLQHPERVDDFLYEALHLGGVDFLDLFKQSEIITDLLGNFDEGAEVLGEATSAKSKGRIQETTADALVHAHAVRHLMDICSGG